MAAGVLAAAGGISAAVAIGSSTAATNLVQGPMGPEGVPMETGPLLAGASTSAQGQPVDGISCDSSEQVAYHVHVHLGVYVNGILRPLPAGVGIVTPLAESTPHGPFDAATSCYYWLHVHAQDGVIHIESPTQRSYTLGQFFDLWGQPLSATQVASATGRLTVFVDGKHYGGDPRSIRLASHTDVQIDVGTPVVPPKAVDWGATGL